MRKREGISAIRPATCNANTAVAIRSNMLAFVRFGLRLNIFDGDLITNRVAISSISYGVFGFFKGIGEVEFGVSNLVYATCLCLTFNVVSYALNQLRSSGFVVKPNFISFCPIEREAIRAIFARCASSR